MKKLLLLLLGVIFIFGCNSSSGGGGSETKADTTNPAGIWTGKTDDNRFVQAFVLDDGRFYAMYTDQGRENMSYLAGVLAGKGSSKDGVFTSSIGTDYNLEAGEVFKGRLSADFTMGGVFNSSYKYSTLNMTSYQSLKYSEHSQMPTNASGIIGTWYGVSAGTQGMEYAYVYIRGDGSVVAQGTESGCVARGTLSPRPYGNMFDISFSFENSTCYPSSTVFSGIAFYDFTGKIAILTPDSKYSTGVMFNGIRK